MKLQMVRAFPGISAHLLIAVTLIALLSTGCVNAPVPVHSTATLYLWSDHATPIASRSSLDFGEETGILAGNFIFSDILKEIPKLIFAINQPLLLQSCHEKACYYAVVFADEIWINAKGEISGYVFLSGVSTALYHQVKNTPMDDVRRHLEELSDLIIAEEREEKSYYSLIRENIRGRIVRSKILTDSSLETEAQGIILAGGQPEIMSLLNGGAKRTQDLIASEGFLFSDAWDLTIDVDVSGRIEGNSYLMICTEFTEGSGSFQVAYDNCQLKANLVDGRYKGNLRMTGINRELLVTVMPLSAPEELEQSVWNRDTYGAVMMIR